MWRASRCVSSVCCICWISLTRFFLSPFKFLFYFLWFELWDYFLFFLSFFFFFCGLGALWDFPGGSDSKASVYNAGDLGSIPGLGRSPGEGNGNPFQYSCLENPMDRGSWQATVHGVSESDTTEWLHFLSMEILKTCLHISCIKTPW